MVCGSKQPRSADKLLAWAWRRAGELRVDAICRGRGLRRSTSWKQEHEPAFQRRAIQILCRGDDAARCRMEENLRVLSKVLQEIRSAKAKGTQLLRDKKLQRRGFEQICFTLGSASVGPTQNMRIDFRSGSGSKSILARREKLAPSPPTSSELQLTIGERRVRVLG